jgi:DNA repair exonuclease SbcCD ATPase subunit
VATFSDDLSKLQELETKYRQQLAEYEAELTAYRTLLDRDPKDPELEKRYEQVESKNAEVQQTYAELDSLRRSLASASSVLRKS